MRLYCIVFSVLFLLPSLAQAEESLLPKAEVTSFQLKALSLQEATFTVELTVKNPYSVGLTVSGLDLEFSVQGTTVLTAKKQGKFSVPAQKTRANTFDVILPYKGLIAAIDNFGEQDWIELAADGKLKLSLPNLPGLPDSKTYEFHLTQRLPAIDATVAVLDLALKQPGPNDPPPAPKVEKPVDLGGLMGALTGGGSLGAKSSLAAGALGVSVPLTAAYTMAFENHALLALPIKVFQYSLYINGDLVLTGETSAVKVDGTTTFVNVVSTVWSDQLPGNAIKVVEERKGKYRITGTALLELPGEIPFGPVPLTVEKSGNFQF